MQIVFHVAIGVNVLCITGTAVTSVLNMASASAFVRTCISISNVLTHAHSSPLSLLLFLNTLSCICNAIVWHFSYKH